jgi:tetratricopeptide (TPR) repeat protein
LERGRTFQQGGNYARARRDFKQAIHIRPQAAGYNALAWLLATCPKAEIRNGKQAVECATTGCKLTYWKDATCLDTLAAAYAESGDFRKAVHWQKKALQIGWADKQVTRKAQDRLTVYERGKPYRDKP